MKSRFEASERAIIKVRTRPPGPPEPPQSPILEDDPLNSKQVIIRWLPVTLTGELNGTQIRGYCVYQNGKNVAEILDPAGDRIAVLRSHIKPGAKVTVRTMTVDGELSTDSGPAKPNSSTMVQNQILAPNMPQDYHQVRNSHFMSQYDTLEGRKTFGGGGMAPNPSHSLGQEQFDMNVSPLAIPPPVSLSNTHSLFDMRFSQGANQHHHSSSSQRPRIRSADFEQENPEWLRHTMDRHLRHTTHHGHPSVHSDWTKSMDRQRARSIPRKMNFNREPIGFLDSINDPIPHGLSSLDRRSHHDRHSYEVIYTFITSVLRNNWS